MSRVKKTIGKKFGKLTAIEKGPPTKSWEYTYVCCCDCGNITKPIRGSFLRNGQRTSCGCVKRVNNKARKPKNYAAITSILLNYKNSAKKRGLEFNLSRDQFVALLSDTCNYCGISWSNQQRSYQYNGIDRVDSSKGYISSNCVTACKQCNRAKRDLAQEEFLTWIARVYNYSEYEG